MRSIDHIFIVAENGSLSLIDDKEPDLLHIRNYMLDVLSNSDDKWKKALEAWKRATSFKGKLYPTTEEYAEAKNQHLVAKTEMLEMRNKEKEEKDPLDVSEMKEEKDKKRGQDPSKSEESDILKYRVTCERRGKHAIESQDVARIIGEVLQDKFHWLVDLSMYHLEIVCKLIDGVDGTN